jgi:zinc protease
MIHSYFRHFAMTLMACVLSGSATVARSADLAPDDLLPQDPNNLCGTFNNGLNFIIRQSANPQDKVIFNLRVATGALNETAQQNGLAHFLEHMAFKGSEHYAPMKLLPLLSHLGMTFGADTNAHTTLTETVFKLNMPDTEPATIDTALTIFSDYANALSLYPIQIESERRVILEEARTKKSAAQRLIKQMNKQLFAGTAVATHDVIGDEELIKTFPQSEFLDYWNTWYRPENMTLLVVGDVDPQQILAAAQEKLGTFTARAPARPAVKAGLKPFDTSRAIILTDPEQTNAQVSLLSMKPSLPPIRTFGQYRHAMLEQIAEWIVNRRLRDCITRNQASYTSASVSSSGLLHEALQLSADADGKPENWPAMLDALIQAIHTASDQGFTANEVDLAKRSILAGSQWAVTQESTRDSNQIIQSLVAELDKQIPILSAQQSLDLASQVLSTLTPDQVQTVFADTFNTLNFAYVLMLPAAKAGESLPTEQAILTAATADWSKPAKPLDQTTTVQSVFNNDAKPGTVLSSQTDTQLGVTTVVFANGVVMHHKQLDTKQNQVGVIIRLPGGTIEETEKTKGLSELASQILTHPATHSISSLDIRDQMIGINVAVQGGIGLDAMTLQVQGSRADLPRGLELANALLTDGKLEQSAVDEWKNSALQQLSTDKTNAKFQLTNAFAQSVAGGDIRFAPLTAAIINRLTLSDAQNWFDHIARSSAIEVTVVGDLPLDKAVELVGKYLGSLPQRKGTFNDLDALRKLDRPSGPYVKTIEFPSVTPTAMVLAGYLGCEDTDDDRRPLTVASMILTERMIQRIRIKDNLVYSISCNSQPGQGIPGLGQIFTAAPTDPKNTDRLANTIIEMFKTLADTGPTDDELATAKKQIANTLDTQMKNPEFWIAQLSSLNYHHHSLAELKQLPDVFNTFTTMQIRDTLRKYVAPGGEIRLTAAPKA